MELSMNCTGTAPTQGGMAAGMVGFDLLATPAHTKYVRVSYDYSTSSLVVDHTQGGCDCVGMWSCVGYDADAMHWSFEQPRAAHNAEATMQNTRDATNGAEMMNMTGYLVGGGVSE